MRINHNLMAMNTKRQMGINQGNSAKSIEKLSSGLRINRAGDDAAGLAISEKMRSQIRGLNQASRNAQDGISMIQTAEGALQETQNILQRMRELGVQSASDTNVDVDRDAIQNEINQLSSEINRIGNTTEFNTMTLLDGTLDRTEAKAATAGAAKGNVVVGKNINLTDSPIAGSVKAGDYGATGNVSKNASAATFTGNVVMNELSEITTGKNNELSIKVNNQEHTLTLAAESATGSVNHTTAGAAGIVLGDASSANNLKVTINGVTTDDFEVFDAQNYDGSAGKTLEDARANMEAKLNQHAGIGDNRFTVSLTDSGAFKIQSDADFKIEAASNDSALALVSGGTMTSADDLKGTTAIAQALNDQFAAKGINAVASYDENMKLSISSTTTGNEGSVEILGGGFASSFLAEKSENTATIKERADIDASQEDQVSIQLEGKDGNVETITLTAAAQGDGNTATTFDRGADANGTADGIRKALEKAIEANENLKGRYLISGEDAKVSVTAANAGDGYAIGKLESGAVPREINLDGGAASDAANTTYVEGKDIGDVKAHGDLGASVTGSVTLTDKGLAASNVKIDGSNNELTFNIDGSADDTTVVLDDATYDGTARTKATSTVKLTNIGNGDNFKAVLKGLDGEDVTLTLTADNTKTANTKTDFIHTGNEADNIKNLKESLELAIADNAKLKGQYEVTLTDNNELTITATKATANLAVGDLTTGTITGEVQSAQYAGAKGATVDTLVEDMQAKIDAAAYSTAEIEVTTNTNAADQLVFSLEKADGNAVDITLTGAANNNKTGANAFNFDNSVASKAGDAYNIATALNAAIEDNADLKGRYEAYNDGAKVYIKATNTGDGNSIGVKSGGTYGTLRVTGNKGAITTTNTAVDSRDAQATGTATVSYENSKLVMTSNNTEAGSKIDIKGSAIATQLFGETSTRISQERLAANNELSFKVDGDNKTIAIAEQTYQDLDEFISVNKDAFTAAGVTASNEDGKLKLTSNTTGVDSSVTDIAGGELAKQLGLVEADGSSLSEGQFVQGADGNTTLNITVDGENVNAEIQKGDYTDANVLAAAVESAINKALDDSGKGTKHVTVSAEDGKLSVTSGSTGEASKIEIGKHASMDAAGVLGLTDNTATVGEKEQEGEDTSVKFQIGANTSQSMSVAFNDMRSNALKVTGTAEDAGKTVTSKDGKAVASYVKVANVTDGTDNNSTEYALDVSDHDKATAAVSIINDAIEAVSAERSKLGAFQNRLEHTIKNLDASSENLQASESRIRDVDMAKEMMNFQKNNILQQAAQSMLAQANQQPQGVLQLLR